jgi:hypothetical protein
MIHLTVTALGQFTREVRRRLRLRPRLTAAERGVLVRTQKDRVRTTMAAFSPCGSLSKSAKRAKVDRRTHYNWLKDHPRFVQGFQQAMMEAGDSLEDKLTEMAFDGNVTAAIFLKFRERFEQKNLVDIDVNQLSDQQLEALADRLIRNAVGNDPRARRRFPLRAMSRLQPSPRRESLVCTR